MQDQCTKLCLCKDHEPSTFDRPALFLPIIFLMFASLLVLFALSNFPYGIQIGSLIPYTAFVFLGTFSAQRGMQPYYFECSIVRKTLPRLARWHGVFLVAIAAVETAANYFIPYMPAAWLATDKKGTSAFGMTLGLLCGGISFAQIICNRNLLERAHAIKPTQE
jgi:hypothetical protein